MDNKKQENGGILSTENNVILVLQTDQGKIGVNTRTSKVIMQNGICQKCGCVLTPTDYFDYYCNRCDQNS